VLRRILGPKRDESNQKDGGNCISGSFIIVFLTHQIIIIIIIIIIRVIKLTKMR
jgi:hypothetical protein